EATLSRMRNRIDQVRVNMSAFTSSSASGSEIGPDDFEGALSALSKDLSDISSLERRIRGLSADVDRIIQLPGIVSILDGRDMRPFLESMIDESGKGSVVDLAERETQVAKREEMVNRKIKAYALKMKQLEAREIELSSGASTEPAAEAQAGGVVSREDRECLVRAISGLCEMVDMNVSSASPIRPIEDTSSSDNPVVSFGSSSVIKASSASSPSSLTDFLPQSMSLARSLSSSAGSFSFTDLTMNRIAHLVHCAVPSSMTVLQRGQLNAFTSLSSSE
ncbi:MAG: hypothetical protein MUO84_03965, partial [Thermoplasmata archaeon]|nr:hypothetical protein [Thermoplasmata archaeon]